MVVVAMPKFGVFTSGDVEAVAGTVLRAVDLPPLVAVTRKCWAFHQPSCSAASHLEEFPLLFDNKLEDFENGEEWFLHFILTMTRYQILRVHFLESLRLPLHL